MGHARSLLSVEAPEIKLALYEQITQQGLSVRDVEAIARNANDFVAVQPDSTHAKKTRKILPEEFKLLREHLSQFFDTKVQLTCSEQGRGKIVIPFDTEEKLASIMSLLDRMK